MAVPFVQMLGEAQPMNPLGTPHQQGLLALTVSCGGQQVSGSCTSVHPLLESGDRGAEANSFHRAHQAGWVSLSNTAHWGIGPMNHTALPFKPTHSWLWDQESYSSETPYLALLPESCSKWTPCLQTTAQAALELHGWESPARTT